MKKQGLSAFIKKQQTKKEKKSEAAATTSEQHKAQDIETDDKKKQMDKNTTSVADKKEESSDEEEDELDIAKKQINYDKIVEKEITSSNTKAGDNDKKMGYGLEEQAAKETTKTEEKEKNKPIKRGGGFGSGGGISFSGGKPTFGNRNKNTGGKIMDGAFSAGLEDLDEEGSSKKKDKKGGPRESANTYTSHVKEEEKEERGKLTGVKPTFKGRMNLRGSGGANDADNAGVVKDYSFNVTFKSENTGGERKQHGEGDRNVDRKDRRQPKDKGMSLGAFNEQKNAPNDEEGFEIVGRETRKKKAKQNDSSSDEEEPPKRFTRNPAENVRGARVERGGNRGGRGRE